MKFSIVIPLYNKEAHISRALASVTAQTHQDWECIVVDDGSTDKGPEIVDNLRDMLFRLIRQKNAGPAAARNRGAQEARAEWIALLDADDYWLDCHLENLANLIAQYPQCRVVGTNFWGEYPNGRRILANKFRESTTSSVQRYFEFNAARKGPLVNSSSVAVRKDLWRKTGGFREAFRLAEDADFWARLCLHTDFAIHHRPSSVYFQDYSGASTRTCLYFGDAPFADLASQIPPDRRWAFNEFLAHCRMVSLALGTLLSGEKALVRKMARESRQTRQSRRALGMMIISTMPTCFMRSMYKMYRWLKRLPMPQVISVEI